MREQSILRFISNLLKRKCCFFPDHCSLESRPDVFPTHNIFFFYFQGLHFEIFSDSCPSHLALHALLAHTIALKFSTQRRRLHRTMVINQCANE